MSQFFNLVKHEKFGDTWHNDYGDFQTFFCQFEGIEKSVRINKKAGSTPPYGATYGDLVVMPDKDYYAFKSAKKPSDVETPQFAQQAQPATQSQAPVDASSPIPLWVKILTDKVDEAIAVATNNNEILESIINGTATVYTQKDVETKIHAEAEARSTNSKPMPADFGVKPDVQTVAGSPVVGEPLSEADANFMDDMFNDGDEAELVV